jgi:sulfur carrier protein
VISVKVNGEIREIAKGMKLLDFLVFLGVSSTFIAVAYNGEVLRREQYDVVDVSDGDILELVRPVGGGAS